MSNFIACRVITEEIFSDFSLMLHVLIDAHKSNFILSLKYFVSHASDFAYDSNLNNASINVSFIFVQIRLKMVKSSKCANINQLRRKPNILLCSKRHGTLFEEQTPYTHFKISFSNFSNWFCFQLHENHDKKHN